MFLSSAESPFFRGGPLGCLLIHGFTSTPTAMRWLGEHVAGQGPTVYGARLAHHAPQPADMDRSRRGGWHGSAVDGWYLPRDRFRRSHGDRTVPPEHPGHLGSRLGSPDKAAFWVEKLNRSLVEDSERPTGSEKIGAWIAARAAQ